LEQFIDQRGTVQLVRSLLARLSGRKNGVQATVAADGPEQYDKWLLEYLKSTTQRYEPKPYSGHITLFRSTQEPTGWMFDPLAGWGQYAQSVALAMVQGNHFTMFHDPGATQMAQAMAPLIAQRQATEKPV
jgi:thioesterase domain-containing protein